MKIEVWGIGKALTQAVEFRRDGLALVLEVKPPLESVASGTATLLFRWSEIVVTCILLAICEIVIHFRDSLTKSWLKDWAVHNPFIMATIITFLAFETGAVFVRWKKDQLFTYAIWEIIFGIFSVFQVGLVLFPELKNDNLIILAGALYVIATGLEDFMKAVENEKEIERLRLQIVKGVPAPPWPPTILPKTESP